MSYLGEQESYVTPSHTQDDYIHHLSDGFYKWIDDDHLRMIQALNKLMGNSSDPALLADYQARLQDYTVAVGAQVAACKTIRDLDGTIEQKFA